MSVRDIRPQGGAFVSVDIFTMVVFLTWYAVLFTTRVSAIHLNGCGYEAVIGLFQAPELFE